MSVFKRLAEELVKIGSAVRRLREKGTEGCEKRTKVWSTDILQAAPYRRIGDNKFPGLDAVPNGTIKLDLKLRYDRVLARIAHSLHEKSRMNLLEKDI